MADKVKKAQAKHELLDAQGNVVEKEEEAHGIRYTQLSNGKAVSYIPKSEAAIRMLAVLGSKTLATNEASQVRQKNGDTADTIPDITDRFNLIESGTWVDRTREGPKWDLDAMAEAAVLNLIGEGKLDENDTEKVGAYKAKLRGMIEDAKVLAQVRGVGDTMAHYNDLTGRKVAAPKTSDELLAMISA